MGHKLSIFEPDSYQVALLGLDNAGKSTIIYRLKMDQFTQQAPTVGFNCEKFRISSGPGKGQCFVVWDVGGQERMRPLWRTYVRQTDAVLFVVDSCDETRYEECKLELLNLLRMSDFPVTAPILLLANKQDLPGSKCEEEMAKLLDLDCITRVHEKRGCCAVTGEGLQDVFSLLHSLIQQAKKMKRK